MSYALRQLEGHLQKVVAVTTTEIEQDDPKLKGQYVFRDGDVHRRRSSVRADLRP